MKIFKQNIQAKKQRGAAMVEYALLVACVALIAYASVNYLGQTVSNKFDVVGIAVAGAGNLNCEAGSPIWPGCLNDP